MRTFGQAIVVVALMSGAPVFAAEDTKGGNAGPGDVNACGCYRDESGACRCQKKGKCVCPGECEPVGCEAKRQKEAEKEAAAEMKRIEAREKKRAAEAAKAAKDKAKNKPEKAEAAPSGDP